jgi:hypothetical protein
MVPLAYVAIIRQKQNLNLCLCDGFLVPLKKAYHTLLYAKFTVAFHCKISDKNNSQN